MVDHANASFWRRLTELVARMEDCTHGLRMLRERCRDQPDCLDRQAVRELETHVLHLQQQVRALDRTEDSPPADDAHDPPLDNSDSRVVE